MVLDNGIPITPPCPPGTILSVLFEGFQGVLNQAPRMLRAAAASLTAIRRTVIEIVINVTISSNDYYT